jgi:hypothetical protein
MTTNYAFVCGTRKVIQTATTVPHWVVVCATCGGYGKKRHTTRKSATDACIRDSGRSCPLCGAS